MSEETFVGRRFAHYRVLERLGAGGMGVVYRAHDETLDREVVLKLLPDDAIGDAAARSRLLDEARKAAALNHPNICTIHEVGESEGQVYFAMERVDGQTLKERVGSRGLPVETMLSLAIQIADALAHAHDRGIIHRDLKSANVMVTPEGRAKVLDFGIARRVDPAPHATALSRSALATGVMAGTAHYLPPEAFRGERVDARGDVWALGVLLHEMLTGRLPFAGNTEVELGAAILNAQPAPLPSGVPAGLRSVIERCLQKDPARRFQRASEVRAVLEMVRGEAAHAASRAPATADAPRPRGRRGRMVLVAVVAALALVLIAVGVLRRGHGGAGSPIRSLAVLPLENLSRDPEQEYFADGMTEELITSLANLEGVRVTSRTSTMRFKGTTKSIPQIARELGVDAVVEGSAMRAGNDVRITAQLIEAATDRHLWARSYQRSLANVLTLQAEVAQAIAVEIRTALTPRGKARIAGAAPALNPAAYEEYLKGRYEWSKRTPLELQLAIAHFERAIAADSSYAAAWAGLADVYAVLPTTSSSLRPRELFAKSLEAVHNALRLDPELAESHATLGLLKNNLEYNWAESESEFRTALALNPSYATAHQWYGLFLACRGRLDEASAELARARELDPLSTVVLLNQGQILYLQRRHDEAITILRQVVMSTPGFNGGRLFLGRAYYAKRMYPAALSEFVSADSLGLGTGNLHGDERIQAAVRAGDTKRFWSLVVADGEKRARKEYLSPDVLAVGHAQLGDLDRALYWLEKGFEEHDVRLVRYLQEAMLDPLRSDPRFAAILRKYGLEP